MTIAVIVANMSRVKTRASSAASNGKESANKSGDYLSAGNFILLFCQKRRIGDVPHKSPRKKALVIRNLEK